MSVSVMSPVTTGFGERVPALMARFGAALDARLPSASAEPVKLHAAMRYACEGGKRLRALLVYAAGQTLGVHPDALDAPACAVELIHAYSLIHDDLPAMDDDDLRRGRPTVHKAFDEATAILAGDALQALAFEVLARATHGNAAQRLQAVKILAEAAGGAGMVGGQAVDLESEGLTLELAQLESLHARKTGALILASVRLASAFADADTAHCRSLDAYGRALGLAYQIQDDVLDETGSTASLGKTQGKDRAQAKSTFPALLGLAAAQTRATETFATARAALRPFADAAAPLAWLAGHIESRDH
jgi:farnesyl diphosphate synthase